MSGGKGRGKPAPHSSWLPADMGKRFLRRKKICEKRRTKKKLKTYKPPPDQKLCLLSKAAVTVLSNNGLKLKVLVLSSCTKRHGLSWRGDKEEGGRDQKTNEKGLGS